MATEIKPDVIERIKTIVQQAEGVIEILADMHGWATPADWLKNEQAVADLAKVVCQTTESFSKQWYSMTGSEKEDYAVAAIDGLIKLPAFLEPFDNLIIRWAIKRAVAEMNQHGWNK